MPSDKRLTIIDETIREGMQYQGVMFSLEQRIRILAFQEKLGVDVCQAGYPSAHPIEAETVSALQSHAASNGYRIRVAAMGRATPEDADRLLDTGVRDLHFHVHINPEGSDKALKNELARLVDMAVETKLSIPDCVISIALLDIGKSGMDLLETCVRFLDHPDIDILSLPDTSGIMAPNQIFDKLSVLTAMSAHTAIAVHCHNDMGMAGANTVMGILAGGRVLEASALGIGERNGMADMATTARHLKGQGFEMSLNTDDIPTFDAYYTYVDQVVYEQTGHHLLTLNTPFFGDAVKTHVAGTHANGAYGLLSGENYFLNGLCGKHLVKKFLDLHHLDCPERLISSLTREIKSQSFQQNRCLTKTDVKRLLASLQP